MCLCWLHVLVTAALEPEMSDLDVVPWASKVNSDCSGVCALMSHK